MPACDLDSGRFGVVPSVKLAFVATRRLLDDTAKIFDERNICGIEIISERTYLSIQDFWAYRTPFEHVQEDNPKTRSEFRNHRRLQDPRQ